MSQLNLKQILSGDNLSSVVDKLNYNFDQIILNGGGPQGSRGNLGSPGLPGAQGLRGFTGPTGEHGTYLFAESGGVGPTAHFVAGGLPIPRIGDVYMDTYPTYLNIYELGATGWNIIEEMALPGGYWKSVADNGTLSSLAPRTTSMSNDILVAEKLLITGASAAQAYLVSPTANPGELKPELTADFLSAVMVGSRSNQLRLLSENLTGATFSSNNNKWSRQNDLYNNQGGIVHSLELAQTGTSAVQLYQIRNGDQYGDKYFSINLNYGKVGATGTDNLIINNSILYGDTNNRAGSGISPYVPLKAQFNIQDSLIVGDSSYYNYSGNNNQVLYKNQGIISQGNLSIGARDNSYYTGAFLGLENAGTVAIDVYSSVATYRESSLSIGTDIFAGKGSVWKFTTNAQSANWNDKFGSLTLGGQLCTNPGSTAAPAVISYSNTMYFGLTNSIAFGTRPTIGVANNDPKSLFEVGAWKNRISIGEIGGSGNSYDGSNYIGFNMHRNPATNNWFRRGDGGTPGYNSGKTIWTGTQNTGLHFSFIPSTGGVDATGLNDGDMTNYTRASILSSGAFWNHPTNAALEGAAADVLGLYIGFGASGATGDMPFGTSFINPGQLFFRRPAAYFGQWGTIGSPVIFSTSGLTQSVSTVADGPGGIRNVLPQYSFYGATDYGLYLAQGNPTNLGSWASDTSSVGLSISGVSGVHVSGNNQYGARVGIGTRTPYERFQIGDYLTYHDGGIKYIGYNSYYDATAGIQSDRRIYGQASNLEGYAQIRFADWPINSTSYNSRFINMGTKIMLEAGSAGDTSEVLSTTRYSANGKIYKGVMISPPLVGNSSQINSAPFTPQIGMGVSLDTTLAEGLSHGDSIFTAKRGTLALSAQMRLKPNSIGIGGMTIEDYYNLGLYSHDGFAVGGIQVAGGNPSTMTTRSLGINLIGNNGDALYEDLSILYSESDIDLTKKYQRRSWFGDSFRIGINEVPIFINSPLDISRLKTGNGHDVASLVASGATAYYNTGSAAASYHPASIHKGSIVIDQTPFSSSTGSIEGIWIKDGAISTSSGSQIISNGVGSRVGLLSSNSYAGDWNIRYKYIGANTAGLAIGKPTTNLAETSNILYLDDTGSIGIGTTNFDISSSGYLRNGPSTISTPTTLVSNILFPRYGSVHSTDDGNNGININGYEATTDGDFAAISTAIPPYSLTIPPAKLSVNGIIKLQGFVSTTSDERLKTELGRINKRESLDAILKLSPVLFQWNEKSTTQGHVQLGLFAQEVEEIIPEAVRSFKSENFDDERQIDYNSVFVMAIGAIKDQQDIIEKQAETIKNLEAKLSKIDELLERNNIS